MEDVIEKLREIRRKHKKSLSGIELMHWNLYWKLRGWIMREEAYRCVCISEIVDKIKKYAPKAILRSRYEFTKAIDSLWCTTHDFSIDSDEYLKEDLEFELNMIYQ